MEAFPHSGNAVRGFRGTEISQGRYGGRCFRGHSPLSFLAQVGEGASLKVEVKETIGSWAPTSGGREELGI